MLLIFILCFFWYNIHRAIQEVAARRRGAPKRLSWETIWGCWEWGLLNGIVLTMIQPTYPSRLKRSLSTPIDAARECENGGMRGYASSEVQTFAGSRKENVLMLRGNRKVMLRSWTRRKSLETFGNIWICLEIGSGNRRLENFGKLWKTLEIFGTLWKSLEIVGNLWKSLENMVWKSLENFGILWKSLETMVWKSS